MDICITKKIKYFAIVVFAIMFLVIGVGRAYGENKLQIFFSGKLLNGKGEIAENGNYNMEFLIYEGEDAEIPIWREVFINEDRILVSEGLFQVNLGRISPLDFGLENQKYWIGTRIGGMSLEPVWDEEMTPRIPIMTLESIFLEGKVEISEEDFVKALIEEFEQNATSTDSLTKDALSKYIQEKISQSGVSAVIISPDTLNLLLEEVLSFQQEKFEEAQVEQEKTIWQKILDFFTRFIQTIAQQISNIFEKMSEIFSKLENIEQGIGKILSILQSEENQELQIIETPVISQQENYHSDSYFKEFGEAVIVPGETTVRVFSSYIREETKIFITPRISTPVNWWISEKKEGEYFEVSISDLMEEGLVLDYWIVTPKEAVEEEIQEEEEVQEEAPIAEEVEEEFIEEEITEEEIPVEEIPEEEEIQEEAPIAEELPDIEIVEAPAPG